MVRQIWLKVGKLRRHISADISINCSLTGTASRANNNNANNVQEVGCVLSGIVIFTVVVVLKTMRELQQLVTSRLIAAQLNILCHLKKNLIINIKNS